MEKIKISVIIPTYNDWDNLSLCIESLKKQTLNPNLFEVIIANNNSDGTVSSVILPLPFFVRIIHEPQPGSYSARNTAIRHSKGKYLAFTDSDCLVSPSWLENGLRYLEEGNTRVAGKIALYDKNNNGNTLASYYEKGYAFNQNQLAKEGISVTANLMIRKEHINVVGLFNSSLFSGGDIEWNRRAILCDIPIIYASDVVVCHPIRACLAEIKSKRKRVIGGTYSKMGSLSLLKLLFPPFKSIKVLRGNNELNLAQKFLSWSVCYYLKLYSFKIACLLKLKIISPSRS
ncbi:glycosyltransferase family 2 protein [Klebsiella pneumoniae]